MERRPPLSAALPDSKIAGILWLEGNDGEKSKATESGEGETKRTGGTYQGGGPRGGVRARSVTAAAAVTERFWCGSPRRAAAPQLLPKFHRGVPRAARGVAEVPPGAAGTGTRLFPFPGGQRVPGASGIESKRAPPAKEIMRVLRERGSGLERSGVSRLGQLCAPGGRGLPWTRNSGRWLC